MADLFYRRLRQPGVSKLLTSQVDFSGIDFQTLRLDQGSRFLLYLDIKAVTGSVNIVVTHAADQNQDFEEKLNETYAIVGPQSLNMMDVQKFVGITIDVIGTATYSLGVTMADNSTSKEAEDLLADIDAKLGSSLPLPVGASTAAKQDEQTAILQQIEDNTDGLETSISSIDSKVSTAAKQDVGNASLASIDFKLTSPISVTGPLTNTQLRATPVPVSASSLPLPTGAATEATLSSLNSKVVTVNTGAVVVASSALPSGASTSALQTTGNASLASIDSKLTNPLPVSGTVTSNIGTTGGLALETTQLAANTKLDSVNASLTSIDSKLTSPLSVIGPLTDAQLRASPVPVTASIDTTGLALESKQDIGNASLASIDSKLTNPLPVSASTLPLPSGASTSAKQDTGNTSLASIDAKLTNPLPVSGTVNVTQGTSPWVTSVTGSVAVTGPLTDTQLRATPVPVSGTVTANIGTTNGLALDATVVALQVAQGSSTTGERGTLTMGAVTTTAPAYTTAQTSPLSLTTAGALRTDGSAVTQPVSATSLPLPTGAATEATLSSLNGKVVAVNTGAVVVSSSALPSGAATSALQTSGNSSLASIDSKLTNPLPVSGTVAVSGSVAVTGPLTDTQLRASAISTSSKVPLTAAAPSQATVGLTSGSVVSSNASRKGLVLINTSTGNISFGIGVAAVLNSGITLTPNGVWEMDEYTFTTAAINAIASVASSNLAIQELN